MLYFVFAGFLFISSAQEYGVTVFGTDSITNEELIANYSSELNTLMSLYNSDRERYYSGKAALEDKLIALDNFVYANVKLFKSYSNEYDFIIDFVENSEASNRLKYREISQQQFDDPDSLIAKWIEYEDLSFDLYYDGEITDMGCPVIHCIWSFNHPKLEPYLHFFNEYAAIHKDKLVNILNKSDSTDYRASASFLLAHSQIEPEELLNALLPSIKDPESVVRNNSMRVIYYIVRAYPNISFDISEVIDALDYPSFTDRNKALVILRSISLDDLSKEELNKLVPILLEILEKKDAHNYRNAHRVLKNLSKKEYPINDITKWKEWGAAILHN